MLVKIKHLFSPKKEKSECVFCKIAEHKKQELLFEDDQFYGIHDINKASAVEHILIITKDHIQTALDLDDPNTIIRMKEIGTQVLKKQCEKNGINNPTFRFGFHLPPFNSVDHIHLHCFVEPLTAFSANYINYGWVLNSVQSVIQKLNSKIQLK